MGLVSEEERDYIKHIMKKAVKAVKKKQCKKAFKYWNSVWNDNGGGGAPGLFYKFTGSSATMNQALTADNKSFTYMNDWLKKKDVALAMNYNGIPSASLSEGGAV